MKRLVDFARRQAEVTFAALNSVVTVHQANSTEVEVRIKPRAFDWYVISLFKHDVRDAEVMAVISGMREQMIESIFANGAKPSSGYPKELSS